MARGACQPIRGRERPSWPIRGQDHASALAVTGPAEDMTVSQPMSGNKTHSLKHSLAYSQWDPRRAPSNCCITLYYAVKSAAVFGITAADRMFACSNPAPGRGRRGDLTHRQEYCLWCDGRTWDTGIKLYNCAQFYMFNSSSEAGETVNIYTIFREFNPRQSVRGDPDCVVACVIVSLRRRHSRYQHDRNNIMITSRVLYKHSHTPPDQPWQPGHQELDPGSGKNQNMILGSTKPLIPAPASSGAKEKRRNISYVTEGPPQKSLAGSRKTLSNRCLFRSQKLLNIWFPDNTRPHIESDTNHSLQWTAFAARRSPAAVCCLSQS